MKVNTFVQAIFFYALSAAIYIIISNRVEHLPAEGVEHYKLMGCILFTYGMAVVFARWSNLPLTAIGISPASNTLTKFVLAFVLGLLLPVIQFAVLYIVGAYPVELNARFNEAAVLSPLMACLLVAGREELAFRSFALFSLNKSYGSLVAIAIVTVLFMFERMLSGVTSLAACIGTALSGVLLGMLAIRTKGIAFPMGLHAAWNFGQWALGLEDEPGLFAATIDSEKEEWVNMVEWVSFSIAMVFGIAATAVYSRNVRFDQSASADRETPSR